MTEGEILMTHSLSREGLADRARKNVRRFTLALEQHVAGRTRDDILADLQLAKYALACLEGNSCELVGQFAEMNGLFLQVSDPQDDGLTTLPLCRHVPVRT